MPKKPGTNPKGEFFFFDVVYEDGSQRSNRRVPAELHGGIDKDIPARSFIIEQDREIADKSGRPPLPWRTVARALSRITRKRIKEFAYQGGGCKRQCVTQYFVPHPGHRHGARARIRHDR